MAKQVQRKRTGSGKTGSMKIGKTSISVDLTGVEASRRRSRHIPEGEYHAKVVSVEGVKFGTGSRGVKWTYEITDAGKGKGWRGYLNNTLIDKNGEVMTNSLWAFRAALQALTPKVKIPDKLTNIDLSKLVGRTVALTVADGDPDEDTGKVRSEVFEVYNEDEMVEDDEDEEEEELEDEDEEDEEDEEEDEDDEEEEEDEEDDDEDEDDDEVDLDEDEL